MSHRAFFISVPLLVLLCYPAQAQEPATGSVSAASATAESRKKAIELLGTVAGQVSGLHSAENRARISSNIADLLWDHDEKRARSLFGAVAEDIRATLNSISDADEVQRRTLVVFLQLRGDTLDRIARHDPDLALEFLRATRPLPETLVTAGTPDREQALELRLAGQIAAKNPQLALKLGRESLANGLSIELLDLLSQLQHKNKDTGLTFYKEIVDKLSSANLARESPAGWLAVNLAQSFQPPEADEQVYRELIGVVLAGALANGCAKASAEYTPQFCTEVGVLFPKIEKYYASRVAPLRHLREFSNGDQSDSERRFDEVMGKGTVDEIVALAPEFPQNREPIYWVAIQKAAASGDVTKARQIAATAPDEEMRHHLLEFLDREQMWTSMNAERLAAVQEKLSRLRTNEERIQLLLSVASRIGGNERKAALGLLNQAGQIIDAIRPGKTQLEGQIALAMLYCLLKSDRGFAIMESVLPRLNELVGAAANLDGFENQYLRDGEWNMTGEGVVGGLLTHLAQNVGYFAALDFDRSVALASQLDRPELRLMAQSKIAQAILTGQSTAPIVFNVPASEAMP